MNKTKRLEPESHVTQTPLLLIGKKGGSIELCANLFTCGKVRNVGCLDDIDKVNQWPLENFRHQAARRLVVY